MPEPKKTICESKNFDALFRQHSRTLRNYIYYKCGDANLAEDLVQEAYIKLWNNCKKIPFANALFFLKRVANNAFLNVVKHQKVVLAHEKIPTSEVTIEDPSFVLEEKEFMQKLENAIANLSVKQREVFLLNRIDKKTYAEIAIFLDISQKAVEKRMRNALKKLRVEIGTI